MNAEVNNAEITELGLSVPLSRMISARGRYSAEEFRRRAPEKFEAVVHLLASGWSKAEIAKELHMDWQTVDAVSQDPANAPAIREVASRIKKLSGQVVEAGLEHLVDAAVRGKLKAFDLKLVHDMHQVSSGLPTAIVEQRVTVSPEEWSCVLDRLRTGWEAGEKSAMGARAGEAQVVGPVIEVEADRVVDDHPQQH